MEEQSLQKRPATTGEEVKLIDIQVTNENVALNLLVNFIHLAQRRGSFNIDESAKIYECIKKFQK